ncbi:MAG TPA: hypothetical protein VGP36_23225 [Mycobacteriales bacterium]|nr:hypothetical protein [Mycobacteriales bacterium]
MANWPSTGDRYDPYDPAHPRWADSFWRTYAVRPGAPPPAPSTPDDGEPGSEISPPRG